MPMELKYTEKEAILSYAKCNMNASEAARKIYITVNAVNYRFDRIKENTGLDARNFYDLVKLTVMSSDIIPSVCSDNISKANFFSDLRDDIFEINRGNKKMEEN